MTEEYRVLCKDCNTEFGYSQASIVTGSLRGLSRPERCPQCRRIHSRESRGIGIPQIPIRPTGPRKPDHELQPGRLGKIFHPERTHRKIKLEGKFGRPDCHIKFGITDEDIRDLIETMQRHQVTVVEGPTGSGKSTFLPYRLMAPPAGIEPDVFTRYGQIVITQPRIQATRSIAEFVARDLHGASLGAGFDVGFRHSGAPASDWRNKLVYLTDGTLINWIVTGEISNLSVIMIDEAHERTLNIDLILGLLKQQLPRFPNLKLIIASATIDTKRFQEFFGGPDNAKILKFDGIDSFKVESYFPIDSKALDARKAPPVMVDKITELLGGIASGQKQEGDILGFLPGAFEIDTCVSSLRQKIFESPRLRNLGIRVYPLHASLPQEAQEKALMRKTVVVRDKVMAAVGSPDTLEKDRILAVLLDDKSVEEAEKLIKESLCAVNEDQWHVSIIGEGHGVGASYPKQIALTPHNRLGTMDDLEPYHIITDRRVVISTNVAETSLTVDGIVYVVDSGLVKESQWVPGQSANTLPTIFHSMAGCRQRWGRAGRVRNGEAHCLYTDAQFEDETVFPRYTTAEIRRSSLEQVVLKARAAGIENLDPKTFDWIEPPPTEELMRAEKSLNKMGALDQDGDLSELGLELENISKDIPMAKLLVVADQYACGIEMATLASVYGYGKLGGMLLNEHNWDFATRYEAGRRHEALSASCRDDLEFFLKLYSIWAETANEKHRQYLSRLFYLNGDVFENKIQPEREATLGLLSIGKKAEEDRPINFDALDKLRIILCTTLTEIHLFKCKRNEAESTFTDIHGEEVELEIDKSSVLAHKPPDCFLAIGRRLKPHGPKLKKLVVSGIVRINPDWLALRDSDPIGLAAYMAGLPSLGVGKVRQRLFMDVRYPIGTRLKLVGAGKTEPKREEIIRLPKPIDPGFSEERIEWPAESYETPPGDVPAIVAWEDKEGKHIAYDENDEKITSGNVVYGQDNLTEESNLFEVSDVSDFYGTTGKFVLSKEAEAANSFIPCIRQDAAVSPGEECQVIGYDYHTDQPCLVIERVSSHPLHGASASKVSAGTRLEVDCLEAIVDRTGKRAIRVQEPKEGLTFIVDAESLSFSGDGCFVDEFIGKKIDLFAEDSPNGAVRFSYLPIVEESIHHLLRQKSSTVTGKVIKQWGDNLFVLVSDPQKSGKQVLIGVFFKRSKTGPDYQLGKSYDFTLKTIRAVGEFIPNLPEGLEGFLAGKKRPKGIFWKIENRKLFLTAPMSRITRDKLFQFSEEQNYRRVIRKLYRHSNRVILAPPDTIRGKQERSSQKVNKKDVPIYRVDEMVTGQVIKLNEFHTVVRLNRGGYGKIPCAHLSWKRVAHPKMMLSVGQTVQGWVRSQQENTVFMTMLNPNDAFLAKYKVGTQHTGVITSIQDTFALAELEQGVNGLIHISEVSWKMVKDISTYLKKSQKVNVRVINQKIALDKPNLPIKLTLSIKQAFHKRLKIPAQKKRFLLDNQGRYVKVLKKKSGCFIYIDKAGTVIVKSAHENQAKMAVAMIKKWIPDVEMLS